MTMVEVVVALAISAVLLAGIFGGYMMISRRAIYASYSGAANALAMKQMEQIVSASWIPTYGVTNLFNPALTNSQTNLLGMPGVTNNLIYATNYASLTQISQVPPYVMIRVDCVWGFMDMGTHTSTVAVLRGPNLN
jgi:type II secretory pathway pseudopilin PulG